MVQSGPEGNGGPSVSLSSVAQVPYIKRRSTVGPPYPRVPHLRIQIHRCRTHRYRERTVQCKGLSFACVPQVPSQDTILSPVTCVTLELVSKYANAHSTFKTSMGHSFQKLNSLTSILWSFFHLACFCCSSMLQYVLLLCSFLFLNNILLYR